MQLVQVDWRCHLAAISRNIKMSDRKSAQSEAERAFLSKLHRFYPRSVFVFKVKTVTSCISLLFLRDAYYILPGTLNTVQYVFVVFFPHRWPVMTCIQVWNASVLFRSSSHNMPPDLTCSSAHIPNLNALSHLGHERWLLTYAFNHVRKSWKITI